jgi:hypothetical protein
MRVTLSPQVGIDFIVLIKKKTNKFNMFICTYHYFTLLLLSMACTIEVLCSNLGGTRDRMTLDKSLTAVCLGSPGRCILITCDTHGPFCSQLVIVVGQNSELSKLSSDSTLYRKVSERRGILSFYYCCNQCPHSTILTRSVAKNIRQFSYYHNTFLHLIYLI